MLLVSSLPFVVFDCIDLHMLCGLLGFRPPFSFRPPWGWSVCYVIFRPLLDLTCACYAVF